MEDRLLYRFRPFERASEIYEEYLYCSSLRQVKAATHSAKDRREMRVKAFSPSYRKLRNLYLSIANDESWFSDYVKRLSNMDIDSYRERFGNAYSGLTRRDLVMRINQMRRMTYRMTSYFNETVEGFNSRIGLVCFRKSKPSLSMAKDYASEGGFLVCYDWKEINFLTKMNDGFLADVRYVEGKANKPFEFDVIDFLYCDTGRPIEDYIGEVVYSQKRKRFSKEDETRLVFDKEKWESRVFKVPKTIRYVVPLFDTKYPSAEEAEALRKIVGAGIEVIDRSVYNTTCN